jgi:hypothetical protein
MSSEKGDGSLRSPLMRIRKRGDVSGDEKGGDIDGDGENGYLVLPGPTLTGSGDDGVGGDEDGDVGLDLILIRERGRVERRNRRRE